MEYMRAHGNTTVPRQWHGAVGAAAWFGAALPSAALLWTAGAIGGLSWSTGLPGWGVLAAWITLATLGGLLYGRVFRRAADDPRGSWLFGICYGFLLWVLGPIVVLQWVLDRVVTPGIPGLGLLGAHLLYGLVLGLLFIPLRQQVQARLNGVARTPGGVCGPEGDG